MTLYEEQAKLAVLCAKISNKGLRVDRKRLDEVEAEMEQDKKNDLQGLEINPRSHVQVKTYFREKYGIHLVNTTRETMGKMVDLFPHIPEFKQLLSYKGRGKGPKAWFDSSLIDLNNHIHPRWNPTGTCERRLSCSHPNLQNVPHRNPYFSNRLRSVVIPEPNCVLVELDAQRGEDWTVGYDCFRRTGDTKLLDLLPTTDLHQRTADGATAILGIEVPRKQGMGPAGGKELNHAHKYGIGVSYAHKMSRNYAKYKKAIRNGTMVMGWEGKDYLIAFNGWKMAMMLFHSSNEGNQRKALKVKQYLMEEYSGIVEWQKAVFEEWQQTGRVINPFGFGRPLWGEPKDCIKRALSFVGASTLQTTVIRGMIDIDEELHQIPHAQIHDSILLSIPHTNLDLIQAIQTRCERDRDGLKIPWEVAQGERWCDL